jgi:S1-C subfamily serine protease
MRFESIAAILAGTAVTSAIVLTVPSPALALSGEAVNDIAREITVLISGSDGSHGSGFIISKSDKTYYVLTAHHVVDVKVDYKLMTADKQVYAIDYSKIKPLPGVDLAVLEFNSTKEYKVAKLTNSDQVKEGRSVYVTGWPKPGTVGNLAGGTTRQFTNGIISGFLEQSLHGYRMTYNNITRKGMSGGPVLDAGGRVIGVHGMGETEDVQSVQTEGMSPEAARNLASLIKPGFNYAIPINTFLQLAPQAGLYLGLQVDNSPAPEAGAPYTAAQPDKRDQVDDLNATLSTVNRTLDTVNKVRNFFRF